MTASTKPAPTPKTTLVLDDAPVAKAGSEILRVYNALKPGEALEAQLDAFPAGLRMWLIEAGAKHYPREAGEGGWVVTVIRGPSPGQGTIPGLHHLEAGKSGRVWTCERDRKLGLIDGPSGDVIHTAPLAVKASHLAVDDSETRLFIADPGDNSLICADAESLEIIDRIEAPGGPQLPLIGIDGIACVTGSATGTLTIARPRNGAGAAGYDGQTIEVGPQPHDPVTSPDGRYAFVPCAGDGHIAKVDLTDGAVLGRYYAGEGSSHLALHPDGMRIFSANTFDGTVSVISLEGDLLGVNDSGAWAHQPEITPDGKLVYVANFLDDTIAVFDGATLERRAVLETEIYPHGLDISPDGKYAIATGFGSDHIRLYDAAAVRETARIDVGQGSSHSAFLADSSAAYIGCSVANHLARVELDRASCTGHVAIS